jgi:hypothetical protein
MKSTNRQRLDGPSPRTEHKWAHLFYYLSLFSASKANPTPDGVIKRKVAPVDYLMLAAFHTVPHLQWTVYGGRKSFGMALVQKEGMA